MIENITHKKKILAIIIRSTYQKKKGVNFFTKKNLIQQVAYMNHAKNHLIQPHTHKKIVRKISGTSEVLIILDGKLRVDFYSKLVAHKPEQKRFYYGWWLRTLETING